MVVYLSFIVMNKLYLRVHMYVLVGQYGLNFSKGKLTFGISRYFAGICLGSSETFWNRWNLSRTFGTFGIPSESFGIFGIPVESLECLESY